MYQISSIVGKFLSKSKENIKLRKFNIKSFILVLNKNLNFIYKSVHLN